MTPNASTDSAEWARRLFHDPPPWVATALSLRDRAVGTLGLRAASPETFRVLAQNEQEVLVGSDDRHLDFRASVRCADGAVDVITVVQIHNLLGWLYLGPVRLVHAAMLRRMLRRAAAHLDPPTDPEPHPPTVVASRSRRSRRAARLGAGLLLCAAGYQGALALGLPLGEAVLGGRASTVDGVLTPGFRLLAVAQAAVLIGFARIFLARAGVATLRVVPAKAVPGAMWVTIGILILNTIGNVASRHPLERWGMAGTTLVISALGLVVATGARRAPGVASA